MKSLIRPLMALAIACGAAFVEPASAHAVVGVSVGFAPPPPRVERVVVRPGYAWIPGYWRWNGVRYYWAGGYWAPARAGYRYVPARWVHYGPAWRFHVGYWRR
ncbi:MAG TPA: YXWGXW repeat-containing protein [Rhodanobacteraceae bacterium]|nr:YXWGXW repeat-containing protein [Rhodanobacteraceae bacterium]